MLHVLENVEPLVALLLSDVESQRLDKIPAPGMGRKADRAVRRFRLSLNELYTALYTCGGYVPTRCRTGLGIQLAVTPVVRCG